MGEDTEGENPSEPPSYLTVDRTKVLVCESTTASDAHNAKCKEIVEGIDARLQVEVVEMSFQDGCQYALDNGHAIVSRSTTGLEDSDQTAGQTLIDNGRIAVHAHGSNNYYEELNLITSVGAIVSVRDVDGSYGLGSEFTLTEYNYESYVTPYMAGMIAKYGLDYPSLTYTQIRQAIRDNASNGGTWQEITGYGTPDWEATETALAGM